MPIYEYKCKKCARLTSAFVRNVEREVSSRLPALRRQDCARALSIRRW